MTSSARSRSGTRELAPPAVRPAGDRPDRRVRAHCARQHAELAEVVREASATTRTCSSASPRPGTSWPRTRDRELRELAQAEIDELTRRGQAELEDELRAPPPPARSQRRPRTSSSRSAPARAATRPRLFAADLARMYTKYAERQRWKVEVMDSQPHRRGRSQGGHPVHPGQRAPGAGSKFERGVHRVQRVPATEASGRIHTSTVTVAVLPEAGGRRHQGRGEGPPGGRLPLVGSRRAGRQHDGLGGAHHPRPDRPGGDLPGRALRRSRTARRRCACCKARLLERAQEEQAAAIAADRRSQVGTGERSERIRTYNFPRGA